ncbi:extensin-1-like [Phoenix dactylifera]|uniref:Extensin-1-like n=1 Tax=Phoenix dactylifera TaxID=42345 RepID=A0A8B7CFU5_PHODC|nr:extensin-1-like [Phoenix dactylifera]
MERRSIDLTTISGKGIKSFVFLKSSLYVTVSLAGGGLQDQKQKKQRTPADRTGGENPEWDHPIRIVLESQDQGLVLQFDIMAQGFFGDRLIGRVRVPVADLSPEDPAGAFRSASYLVQTSDRKPNGVLSFLYKMNGGEGRIHNPPPASAAGNSPPKMEYCPPSAAGNSPPKMEYCRPSASISGYYPPPPASAAGNSPPKMEYCRPSASTSGYYPPPPAPALVGYPPAPNPAIHYPAPDTAIHYPAPDTAIHYPPLDPAIYYPPPPEDQGYYPRPYPATAYPAASVGGYYPPVSPVPVHVAYYPPQEPYGYLMEGHRQETYRCH